MHRQFSVSAIGFLVLGLLTASPAVAGDESALQEKVNKLTEQVAALSAQQNALLSQEVTQYLERNDAWQGAQGGASTPWDKVTLHGRATIVSQSTVGLDQTNRTIVTGDLDLDFDVAVCDTVDLFVYMTANTDDEAFEEAFDGMGSGGSNPRTAAAFLDDIGVNGTVSTDPGSVTLREGGIRHRWQAGDGWLHWEMGAFGPRDRFGQSAMTDDENTQFMNNEFDDASAVPWLNTAGNAISGSEGSTVFGIHMWIDFGADKNVRVSAGMFNFPGQFFNDAQFFVQIAWKGEVSGRAMNLRVFLFLDNSLPSEFGVDPSDTDFGGGVTWDWWVTAHIGLFAKIAANGSDENPCELDGSVGALFNGIIGSRPDDQIGVGIGYISLQDGTDQFGTFGQDTELIFEVYYRLALEGNHMHLTFDVQLVSDPGGGLAWADDTLVVITVRIYVPF